MRTKALTADERRYTQIGMIRSLLFTVDYYQGAKATGIERTDFDRDRDRSSERNLRKSAVRFFLRSLRSFLTDIALATSVAAIPSCFFILAPQG